jgi:tetratricopeptide (TPR) repeat protein
MGKLILCSGVRTIRPYVFASTGIRIYSIEELCYYFYHHVYMIDEAMLCDDLFDWIGTELKLEERAQKLKQLMKQKTDLKTMVTVVLCSADYYTEYEIKGLLKMLDEVIGMPLIKRNCMKANSCLKNRQYKEAATEYERIINSMEASELSPEEYGDIYHNLAVAKVHITGLKEASRLFCQAYQRNHRDESLKQYLYTLRLCNNDEQYLSEVEENQVSGELVRSISDFLELMEEEAKNSEQMQELLHLKKRKAQGKMGEYYKKTEEIIDSWKLGIRQI